MVGVTVHSLYTSPVNPQEKAPCLPIMLPVSCGCLTYNKDLELHFIRAVVHTCTWYMFFMYARHVYLYAPTTQKGQYLSRSISL